MAGFAPLVAGDLEEARLRTLLDTLESGAFLGNPDLRFRVPPSSSPDEPRFHPRSYWRGPVWPVMTWLLWWSLLRSGQTDRAGTLRKASLEELAAGSFAEYFEPFTGEPLGSDYQSWTAAVVLDWLVRGDER